LLRDASGRTRTPYVRYGPFNAHSHTRSRISQLLEHKYCKKRGGWCGGEGFWKRASSL